MSPDDFGGSDEESHYCSVSAFKVGRLERDVGRARVDDSSAYDDVTVVAPMVFCDCPFCAEEATTKSEGGPIKRG